MITVDASLPAAPAALGRLIDASFNVWLRTLRGCFPLLLAAALIGLLPLLWMPALSDPWQAIAELSEWLLRPSTWLLYLLSLLLNLLCVGAAVYRMGMLGRGQDPGLGGSLLRGLERLPALLGAAIGYCLLLLLSLLPWLALLIGLTLAEPSWWLLLVAFLASLPLLVPATWLSLAAIFFLHAVMLERCGPIASLRRSLLLIKGHWWRSSLVIGVALTVYLCVAGAAAMLAGGVAASVTLIVHGAEGLQQPNWMFGVQLLFAPLNAAGQLLVYAGLLVMFNDLVHRRALD